MKKNAIIVKQLFDPIKTFILQKDSGTLEEYKGTSPLPSQGNCHILGDNVFSLYCDESRLFFQWNHSCWNLAERTLKVEYHHDFKNQKTRFSIDGNDIAYDAWWLDDPAFDLNLPELDEEKDYLGYIYSVYKQPSLQEKLISNWQGKL